jgi:uncharacterized protein (TIGR02145 family)
MTYNLATHICLNNEVVTCGNKPWNPTTQFCHENSIVNKCGETIQYNPETEACCGNGKYTLSTQFCHNSSIVDKCGGTIEYVPGTEACCGSGKYTLSTQFCYESSKIGTKCGVNPQTSYDPDVYECKPSVNANGIFLKTPVSHGDESYEAVLIGTQVWLARNLNYSATGSECYQNNCSTYGSYGKLYNWATAMQLNNTCNSNICADQVSSKHKGVCPTGWHIPTKAEWDALTLYIDPDLANYNYFEGNIAGTKLKSESIWNSHSSIPFGTNNYGFSALPGGYRYSSYNDEVNKIGYWWSATEATVTADKPINANRRLMFYDHENLMSHDHTKTHMYSVRCLKD